MTITLDGTSGIASVDGSAGSPSVRGSDANSGIVYAADTVAISTGGSERVRVASNGRVGIGETSPDTNLHINGGASNNVLKLESTDGTCSMEFYDNATTDGNQPIAGGVGNNFFVETGGSERLRVQSDGHVKITDGDLVIGTGGHGIDFSAQTTSSATGATPATSSGDERLDHYEKGTWTPVINKAGTSGSIGSLTDTKGVYIRCGDLLWLSFYVYKGSGDTFGSGSDRWYISGLPFSLTTLGTGAYQFIPVGYFTMNGGTVNQVNHNSRWQSNSTNGADTITMYGTGATDNWSSGIIEMSGAGVLQLA